jgi:predicted RNA-binding protein with PUA-like domain
MARIGHWLVKSDPESYGFSDLEREGRTVWDGVRNALALRHLGAMRAGDECLVYESGAVKAVVGRARVASAPRPDPRTQDPKRLVVELEAVARLPVAVPLAAVRSDPAFADLALVRHSRLSVMPVAAPLWKRLVAMGGRARPGAPRRGD